jgi:hypothetical protein
MTEVLVAPLYPPFEGADVHAATLKVSGTVSLSDVVAHVDDVIEVVVQCRVVGVNHVVHTASGQLFRVQTATAIDARLVGP